MQPSSIYIFTLTMPLLFSACDVAVEETTLIVPDVVQARTLLMSEIHSASDWTNVIECPIEIQNPTDSPQTVKLVSTGCSCYGVIFNGRKLKRGESIEVAANDSLKLNIDAQSPQTESSQEYQARFEFLDSEGSTNEKGIFCHLRVYQDLKVFPKVLICETKPGVKTVIEKELYIERIFRSPDGESKVPVISGLPSGTIVHAVRQTIVPTPIEDGIWQAKWTATLQIELDGELAASGKTDYFPITVVDLGNTETPVAVTNKIIRRIRLPVRFPQKVHFGRIPTGETRKRSLFLSSAAESTFRLKVESSSLPNNVRVSVPKKLSTQYKVDVFVEGLPPGDWSEKLTLTTDFEEQPEIEVELRAIFVKPAND